jgi:hypothetical protein
VGRVPRTDEHNISERTESLHRVELAMGPRRMFLRTIGPLIAYYVAAVAAHDLPRGRIQELCPELTNRGLVDSDNATWLQCGEGAFHESRDVPLDLFEVDVTGVVFDAQKWPEKLSGLCQGAIGLAKPRIVKACQSTVDSRDVFAILRAQIVCADGDNDMDGDGSWEYDDDEDDHDCDADDSFCLFRERGPMVIDALWGMEIDISSGQFRLEDLCIREVPVLSD